MLPILSYNVSKSKIGILVILAKKTKLTFLDFIIEFYKIFDSIFGINIKNLKFFFCLLAELWIQIPKNDQFSPTSLQSL